ncbi:MAG TPA: carbon starvation CstA family protein, partial [Candidatus Hydrogenedentes bacterium]|nr:carbon starvation CstA family protein [Candidatus Hydrogenedentota bacterium]
MMSVLLFLGVCLFFWGAYATYARYLESQVFQVDPSRVTPSREINDGVDYVPTRTPVLFGHHFTSIAGTGPIVGPAIAMFWGWLPALLWIALGAVFIGAVHDYGSLMVSLRSRGQTIGDAAGRMVNPRMRLLFLVILFFTLTVVIAMFALVIATIFSLYPQSVLSVWGAMPLAVFTGWWI